MYLNNKNIYVSFLLALAFTLQSTNVAFSQTIYTSSDWSGSDNTTTNGGDDLGNSDTLTIEAGDTLTVDGDAIVDGKADDSTTSNQNTINIFGSVNSTGASSDDAIDLDGQGHIVNIYGTVLAEDDGIRVAATDSQISIFSSGTVTSADGGSGIHIEDTATVYVYSGAIINGDLHGLEVDGDIGAGNTIHAYGRITGADGDAIDVDDGNTITIYNGAALSGGDDGITIDKGNTLNVYGSITALGDVGINANDDDNIINIYSGAIITAKNSAIELTGDSTLTIQSGATITSSDLYGIWLGGNNNTINISGTVFAATDDAIYNEDQTGNIFIFGEGARIVGGLDVGTGSGTLKFDVGSAMSYVYGTSGSGSWTVEDLDGRAVVEGSAMAAGIGNAETADELMFDRSMSLDNSLSRITRQSSFGERQALFDAYGFSQSRDEDGTTSAYDLDSRGMTIGLPLELLGNQAIAFVNYHDSEIDIASGTHDIDAQSLRFGLSVPQMWSGENYNIGVYAVAGRNSYDGVRDVLVNQNTTTGITSIAASWNSSEVELGIDAATSYQISPSLSLDSSLGLAAQVERIGSYAEENYFAWDGRTIVQAHAKAEVTLGYQATDTTRLYGTAGAWRRNVKGGRTAHYSVNSTGVNYNGGIYDDTVRSLQFGMGHHLDNGAILTFEASAMDSGATDENYGASLGVSARF